MEQNNPTYIPSLSAYLSPYVKANELLPDANTKIENVTSSLIEIAVNISEQLAIATRVEDETGLFPNDLDSTNQVVSKVSSKTAGYKKALKCKNLSLGFKCV